MQGSCSNCVHYEKRRCNRLPMFSVRTRPNRTCRSHCWWPAEDPADCPRCEGGGWVEVYSPFPPAFEECPLCYNQEEYPCP